MESLNPTPRRRTLSGQTSIWPVEEETQVSSARRAVADCARIAGLSGDAIARAELVVVELAGNLLRHAGSGRILVTFAPGPVPALQIVAIDSGPGIGSIPQALRDGFTTGETPGTGLGAIRRQAGAIDLFSAPGKGTVLSALVGDLPLQPAASAAISHPITGEVQNGDGWSITAPLPSAPGLFAVVDGLGHGPLAHQASSLALEIVAAAVAYNPAPPLAPLVEQLHTALRATRGAALALVSVSGDRLTCCGVGNVSVLLHAPGGGTRSLLSHNGTVGHRLPRVQEFTVPVEPNSLLVMYSDGILTRWRMADYPGLQQRAPATVAGVIFRDALRGRDDATVLVARLNPASPPAEPAP